MRYMLTLTYLLAVAAVCTALPLQVPRLPQAPPVQDCDGSCCGDKEASKGCTCDCAETRVCTCGPDCVCPACDRQSKAGIPFTRPAAAPGCENGSCAPTVPQATYRSTLRTMPYVAPSYQPLYAPAHAPAYAPMPAYAPQSGLPRMGGFRGGFAPIFGGGFRSGGGCAGGACR